jgi:hypothetical protein
MKTLRLSLLMILLAGSIAAQAQSSTAGAPDLVLIKIDWHTTDQSSKLEEAKLSGNPEVALRNAVNASRVNTKQTPLSIPAPEDSPPPVLLPIAFIYEFTVRNTGTKTIRGVVWEYAFIGKGAQPKVRRRRYESKVSIGPGMTANLLMHSFLSPLEVLDDKQTRRTAQGQSTEQLVIQSIRYADGSLWQRGSK